MAKGIFIAYIAIAWTIVVIGTGIALPIAYWLEVLVVAASVAVFGYACHARASVTQQQKTATWATGLYAAGFGLFATGFGLKTFASLPLPLPAIVTGGGVWSIGAAWFCVAALWNAGWFVKRP
ncbi:MULTISPECIES: hypothetical protein [Novosphingobium]|uniref:hypothetical protein n=1 Tax=Novosphingobium TaxID=165696 RepID=UPI001CD391B7|nr:hypothetical protein [Novosphingobium percolationis]